MDKKNFTPNAIEDDNLEGVSGGTGYADVDLSSMTREELSAFKRKMFAERGFDPDAARRGEPRLGSGGQNQLRPNKHSHSGKS